MDQLKAQKALFGVLRRTANKIVETPESNWTAGLVESRLNILEGYWRDFCNNHIELLTVQEESIAEYLEGDTYFTAEDCFAQAQGVLFDHKTRLQRHDVATSSTASLDDASATNISLARLPRITLPRFIGRQEDWESFRDLFIDLIHNNTVLGDATKALFLKTNVDGDAKDALHEFKPIESEYAPAWEALKSRYDQPKLQVQDHLEAILTLQPLKEESASELQKLVDKLKRHQIQLEALKRPVQHWDDWFVYLGSKAMDDASRRAWEEELGEVERTKKKVIDPSFVQLTDFLQQRCRTLRSIVASQPEPVPTPEALKKATPATSSSRTIRTHATGANQEKGCPACKKAHYIGHCLTYHDLHPEERRRLVTNAGLCYNCLSGKHIAVHCPSDQRCKIRGCSGAHHTLINEGAGKRPNTTEPDGRDPKQPRIASQLGRERTTILTVDSTNSNRLGILSYCQFMSDYAQLGHMRPLTQEELTNYHGPVHYINHHGIWQRSDGGKKLRVVFNASRSTDSGYSFNDALYSGQKLQGRISTVVTRWRRHRFVFCADIKMMFRQIKIRPDDIHLQRILWSPSSEAPVQHYVLLTVTYGTACAPYLALRTLKQLCADEGSRFPEAVETVEQDLYIDDFLSGSHDLESTKHLRDQLIGLLTAGGFSLKKWVANDAELLAEIPPDDRLRSSWVKFSTEGPVSELGMGWDPVTDQFKFRPPPAITDPILTKRKALAELASTFDPVGWLTRLTLVAKLIIQDLWRAKLDWDESLPESWIERWLKFREGRSEVAGLSIPRWFKHAPNRNVQLHAFSDASRRAMTGVLYSRTTCDDGETYTVFVEAKSKLADQKPHADVEAAASSDGPIGNDLVDNYVAHIQELTAGATWHHVPTDSNPADVASRGADALTLIRHPLWWNGPDWLAKSESEWPPVSLASENSNKTPEIREQPMVQCLSTQLIEPLYRDHLEHFSTLRSLLRGTARICRWFHRKIGIYTTSLLNSVKAIELRQSFLICAKLSQRRAFATEIGLLQKKKKLQGQSTLKTLEPFLDEDGVLRVGGRLDNSALPYDERHPVLLDGQSHLAQLVLRWAHERSLHGGFRATYARVLQKAWITGGKVRVKRYIRQCLVCARIAARTASQGMAPLPAVRVTPSRPFSRCGVDYAGPFSVHRAKGRGLSTFKGYVALFVCMATKAIHLELVGDLTTDSFLGALTRFVGRRGRPFEIWSNNGTNFRGANLELQRLLREAEIDWGLVEGSLAEEGTTWKFITPAAPHFGGLWEAGVKSMKAHLQRIAGPRRLTFEEFSTLLVSIEMILNSRPLVPPTGDLGDLEALTPSHFLSRASATSFPRPSIPESQLDRATHWKLVRAMRDNFWDRWTREYLNTLIQRPKWRREYPNLAVGDFMIVVDPSLLRPDGRWPLGRIIAVHPGRDGLVRTVTVKTASGEYLRSIVKVARLPLRE